MFSSRRMFHKRICYISICRILDNFPFYFRFRNERSQIKEFKPPPRPKMCISSADLLEDAEDVDGIGVELLVLVPLLVAGLRLAARLLDRLLRCRVASAGLLRGSHCRNRLEQESKGDCKEMQKWPNEEGHGL